MTEVQRGSGTYALGGARIFFNKGGHLGAVGNGFQNLGNVVSFNESSELTKLPHFAFIAASLTRVKDLDLVSEQTRGFQMVLDELAGTQWDIISSGDGLTTVTQTGGTITGEKHDGPVLVDGTTVMFADETDISDFFMETSGGAGSMLPTTDYVIVNPTTGEIRVVAGGGITTGLAGLQFNYTSAERIRSRINVGNTAVIQGALRVEYQTQNGNPMTYLSHNVVLSTSTPPNFESTAYTPFTLDADILVDTVVDTSNPFGQRWIG